MTYYAWFIVFAVVAYFIATDESVAAAFYYVTRIIKNKYLIFQWWLIHNPATPWAKYSMWRRSNKLAKELMKELESRNK
jgi:hypothetical protein